MSTPQPEARNYTPLASMIPFHESRCMLKALEGPVGSGKSSAACLEWFFLCRESKVPVRGVVLRESYRQLRDSTLPTFQEWFGPLGTYNKGEETFYATFPNVDGVELTHPFLFRHARRPEDASNLLSTEFGFMWLEECVPAFEASSGVIGAGLAEGILDAALMRQRQRDIHQPTLICTFNPPSRFHWAYRRFHAPSAEQLIKDDIFFTRSPAFENRVNLPVGYYERLLKVLRPELARRFIMGESVTVYPGKPVFGHLIYEKVHFTRDLRPVPGLPLVCAFDFGLTPVCLISQCLPNGRLQIYREIQLTESGIVRLCEQARAAINEEFEGFAVGRSWGDPAGTAKAQTDEKTCFQILNAEGFNVAPGPVDFTSRFEAVANRAELFIDGEPALLIDSDRCPMLTEGMLGGYRYPRATNDNQIGRQPLKNEFSHSCDALQYLCGGEYRHVSEGRGKRQARDTRTIPKYDPFSQVSEKKGTGWMSH